MRYYKKRLRKRRFQLKIKRLFDVTASFTMLVLLFPVFIYLAIAIKRDSKGPVFYRQLRVTTGGRIFRIYKFRTMVCDADKRGGLTGKNDSRITAMGHKLRKRRLDELPQLFNILVGDMSFVGTRPESVAYVKAYDEDMKATLLLPAGVTSLASIKYKDEDEVLSRYTDAGMDADEAYIRYILPDKMVYNLDYLAHFSLWLDIKILFMTVREVWGGDAAQ
ncbi:MAG: sugar transferase [Eubacteriales bacterium]|nr:sugar transferase [Eubacteriales bacterium]